MDRNEYNDPIVSQWNSSGGVKYAKPTYNERHPVVSGMFALVGLPDEQARVQISGHVEINIRDAITQANQFKVDYTNGYVFFHSSKEGNSITVAQYASRGANLYPASRVYTKLNNFGEVIETLGDVIEDIGDVIGVVGDLDNAINNANTAKSQLNSSISTGGILKTGLDSSIFSGDSLKPLLDSSISDANTSKGELDSSVSVADGVQSQLSQDISDGSALKGELNAIINSGNTLNTDLTDSIDIGSQIKDELDPLVTQANTVKGELSPIVTNAGELKVGLSELIDDGNILNDDLLDSITRATDINEILSNDVDGVIRSATDVNIILSGTTSDANDIHGSLSTTVSEASGIKVGLDGSIGDATELKGELDDILAGTDLGQVTTDIIDLKKDQHNHTNKYVLDDLSDSDGQLKYKGSDVGVGDMEKTIYDTNNSGKVDISEDAEKLGGQLPNYYAKVTDIHDISGKADIIYVDSELANKVNSSQVLTDVPADAKFTDTITPIVNNLTETEEGNTLDATQGRILDNKISTLAGDISELEHSELSSIATNADNEGVYINTEWKRMNLTLYAKSTLLGSFPSYNQIKVDYYDEDGINIIKTITWNLTYDENGFPHTRMVV